MPDVDDRVTARFEVAQIPFLSSLVEAASCTREPDDVEAAAQLIDKKALALGMRLRRVPDRSGAFADHRVYETEVAADRRCLTLVGHVDTVFPRALGFFGFRRQGDTAYGPGVLDMKSGLSCILFALEAIDDLASLPVRVILNTDEEVGSPSSAALFEELAPLTSEALVFEAGRAEDRIITARKGTGSFVIEATGRAAHSGLAHADGVNAIAALAEVVRRVEAITDYPRGVTLNVGLIGGGTSANTVPARARCELDARYERPADRARVVAALEAALAAPMPDRLADATFALSGGFHRRTMQPTPENRALMRRYAVHARAAGLGAEEAPLQGGGSDANIIASYGVACIDGLGPAGSGVHQISEQCDLPSLRAKTVALSRFLQTFPRG